MKQFGRGIPAEMLGSGIDGASEARTFVSIVLPMVKPGISALAIFTFINSWNGAACGSSPRVSTGNLTISLGIAKLQGGEQHRLQLSWQAPLWPLSPIIIIFISSRSTSPRASQWVRSKS